MKRRSSFFKRMVLWVACCVPGLTLQGANQTEELSRIYSGKELPFTLEIKRAGYSSPLASKTTLLQKLMENGCLLEEELMVCMDLLMIH